MKKVLILISLFIAIMFASCGGKKEVTYSNEELREAIAEAKQEAYERGYEKGYEEGYDLAKYEDRGELEHSERYINEAYDAGYEEGYSDCLEEHGLASESEHGSAWIEKDK